MAYGGRHDDLHRRRHIRGPLPLLPAARAMQRGSRLGAEARGLARHWTMPCGALGALQAKSQTQLMLCQHEKAGRSWSP